MIKFDHLKKKFGTKVALDDISGAIPSGVIVGLLGVNGSGKSTLLKILAGVQVPTAGSVSINGFPVGKTTKAMVSYSSEGNYFYNYMTIRQVLEFQETFFTDFQMDKAKQLLSFMELDEKASVKALSKGMKARLKLVAALAREAKLQLLDEPFSGIDPLSRKKILLALLDEFRLPDQTIVLSTHEVLEAESLFDSVIFLDQGKILLTGSADELRSQHNCSIQDLFGKVI